MATFDNVTLGRLVKRANRQFAKERKGATEFSFHNESERVRMHFLAGVGKCDCWIVWEALDKRRSRFRCRQEDWRDIYDGMCLNVLRRVHIPVCPMELDITVDKFYTKEPWRKAFDARIIAGLSTDSSHRSHRAEIHHSTSMNAECLQVHDFIAGSIFHMLERGNPKYYMTIEGKVVSSEIRK